MNKKRKVVIGVLGTVLDRRGKKANRWTKWRPTVGLCQQPDLDIGRFELLHQVNDYGMAHRVKEDIEQASPSTEVVLHEVDIADPWDFEEVCTSLLDFSSHYQFDTDNEEYLVHITTGTHVVQICWFLLTEAHYLPAKLIQTSPSQKGREKDPIGIHTVIDLDLSRYTHITSRFQTEQQQQVSFLKSGIATRNAAFNTMIEQIERVALRSKAPILLNGPTGAGKSFLARRIYQLRESRHQVKGRFVEVNCATLRGDNAMSTLFGHVKGAFTGAINPRRGLLKEADGGILFLDEIAELGLDEQAMLLKAIEEKSFFPYGSDEEIHSDFQLIAGTHRNLAQQVEEGKFREDLFARINMWTFALPGLRDRREDIEPNIDYELAKFCQDQQSQIRFDSEARNVYVKFACSSQALWRGNFRELGASISRMATFAERGRITKAVAEEEIGRLQAQWQTKSTNILPQQIGEIDLFDQPQLATVLEVCRRSSTLSEAGRELFAVSRQQKKQPNDADRLRKYLAKFGLDWDRVKADLMS
ncbi:RNA repair transcriptional activator RtcR [Providencia hangzhouensis]|uniref:Transcriptional regulatory protein ZraR n=1 Tax=Providencia rettgeri TaxID=587 RepID=A0A9N8GZA3_PRORE|nr:MULTISPECIES: RNA repair transcriptional activator RtcR [Providencia]MBN7840699.1 RNA repair transcriptional activator RtcR [Providencia rettgeri]MBN7852608.1 RNA repair transcriptional activator RtcR [Providencia rettgeri]MBN7861205.1 RNA repair transcriptional activator RtcR [Providencia rettgeri]MBN7871057.1 RNA repair transcriptional activator RtcR [Providencia rettgeri]MBN7895922.1 RNA repair transcriptional activator RtcR [Providencia rettgeri]